MAIDLTRRYRGKDTLAARVSSDAKRVGGKVARSAKRLGEGLSLVGRAAAAAATEPFTNKLLNEHMRLTDRELERKPGLSQRYSR